MSSPLVGQRAWMLKNYSSMDMVALNRDDGKRCQGQIYLD